MKDKYFEYGETEMQYLKSVCPYLSKVIDRYGIINRKITTDVYIALVDTVVGQLLSAKAAQTIYGRFEELAGEVTPEKVNKLSVEQLRGCGLSYRKAETIKDITNKVLSKELDLDGLENLSDKQVIKELSSIKGIGEWSAEMIMLFSLQRKDVLSYKDLAIRRGICRLYGLESIEKETFEECRKRFSPYNSVASLYLWQLSHE